MAGFGEALRSERERRGVTLEMLCAQTKVSERYLQALEHEEYAALPGGIFRRGIVRAYCTSLGLDEQVWMPRFQTTYAEHARAHGEPEEEAGEAWAAFAENVKKSRNTPRSETGIRWMGVVALLLTLLAAAWAVFHHVLGMQLSR